MQGARIDNHLNLVLPVETTALGVVHVYATPIGRPVFERYYRVMARAWSLVMGMGSAISGPKIAAMELRQTAQDIGVWDGPAGVERGLVAEIRRLTNVVCPAEAGGWEPMLLEAAFSAGVLTQEDVEDIEGVITFFTLASALQQREALKVTLGGLTSLWGAQTTSSTLSEWIASLPTSTATAATPPAPTNGTAKPTSLAAY